MRLRVRGNRVEGGVPVNASCQLVKQEGRPAETARLALLRSASSEVLLLRGDLPAREERRAEVRGRVQVYSSEPDRPPQDEPFAYDPSFVAYEG